MVFARYFRRVIAPYFAAGKFCHEAPSRAVSGPLGLALGLASDARSNWRKQWRLAFALEPLLNCAARLLGGLRALLVGGDGVGKVWVRVALGDVALTCGWWCVAACVCVGVAVNL